MLIIYIFKFNTSRIKKKRSYVSTKFQKYYSLLGHSENLIHKLALKNNWRSQQTIVKFDSPCYFDGRRSAVQSQQSCHSRLRYTTEAKARQDLKYCREQCEPTIMPIQILPALDKNNAGVVATTEFSILGL